MYKISLKNRAMAAAFIILLVSLSSGCNHPSVDTTAISERSMLEHVKPPVPLKGTLIAVNGQKQYFVGANYPWHRYGNDFGGTPASTAKDWESINSDFARMQKEGVQTVRWWVFADGRSEPKFGDRGLVTGLGPNFLPDIDRALQIAFVHKISLILTISDYKMFVSQSVSKSPAAGHPTIILLSTVQQSFLENALKPLLIHLSRSSYRSEIAGIDLINEPETCTAGFYSQSGIGVNLTKAFVVCEAQYVHAFGKGLYATLGSARPYWANTWKGLGLDYYSVHYYPAMDAKDQLAQTLPPGNGLETYHALNFDRPCLLEEFPSADSSYRSGDKSVFSADWYLNQARARGYAGALAWSYGNHDAASNWKKFAPSMAAWRSKNAQDSLN